MAKTLMDNLVVIDGYIRFCEAKIPDNGEDADWISINEQAVMAGTFDGAGGSGAKRYQRMRLKTGAYVGARVIAGATKTWFEKICSERLLHSDQAAPLLKTYFTHALEICKREGATQSSSTGLKSKLAKEFPSTAAVAVCTAGRDKVRASFYWAGDSRGYILDRNGLAQITKDDLDDVDAMENLSADGVMTNIVTSSKDFQIHSKTIDLWMPCIVFTASDGCFGYLSTPMEFEYVLLETLLNADSLEEWENNLKERLGQFAEDDYTMDAILLGFGSFQNLKKTIIDRANHLFRAYISKLSGISTEEKRMLWETYKENYYRY